MYNVHRVNRRLAEQLQRFQQILAARLRHCHDVAGGLVSHLGTVLNHINGCRNRLDVGCHAHQIHRTVASLADVALVVGASNVRHDRDFHVGVIVSDNVIDVLIAAKLPLAKVLRIEQIDRSLISKLHVIRTGCQIGLVQVSNEIIRKAEVVAQSSVANGAVQHADVFAEGHQIAFLWCHCSSPFPFAVTLVD